MPQPIAEERLQQLTNEACDSVFASVGSYNHSSTESWNTEVINTLLKFLTTELSSRPAPTASADASSAAPSTDYKWCVTSTIIQHAAPTSVAEGAQADDSADAAAAAGKAGRRGMHTAAGAYWNSETDGMWNFKYAGLEKKGLDVVVSVFWIAV